MLVTVPTVDVSMEINPVFPVCPLPPLGFAVLITPDELRILPVVEFTIKIEPPVPVIPLPFEYALRLVPPLLVVTVPTVEVAIDIDPPSAELALLLWDDASPLDATRAPATESLTTIDPPGPLVPE